VNIKEFKWSPADLQKMAALQEVKYLVLHHTNSHDAPVEEIDKWHRNRKSDPFIGIGYHYVIRACGAIEKGRPDSRQGAHVLKHNHHSIGIALTGRLSEHPPTPEQLDALEVLLTALRLRYPHAELVGHFRLQPTECPGNKFPWDELWERLQNNSAPDLTVVPEWARTAVSWAVNVGLVNNPAGSDDFYRFIAVLYKYHKEVVG